MPFGIMVNGHKHILVSINGFRYWSNSVESNTIEEIIDWDALHLFNSRFHIVGLYGKLTNFITGFDKGLDRFYFVMLKKMFFYFNKCP